jgi:ComF family protein
LKTPIDGYPGEVNLKLGLYRAFWLAVDWVYPPSCAGCGEFGERWCAACQSKVQKLESDLCPKCGLPEPHFGLCSRCQAAPPPYEALRSWGRYNGTLREAIHRMKYRHDLGLAEALSRHLIKRFRFLAWPVDLVTAVPLSPRRLRERGYNQSDLLARPLSLDQHIPFIPAAVFRTRETISQVGLSAAARHDNVRDAFAAIPGFVSQKNVLLVDDVATTGATLNYCTAALLQAGARRVYGLTLARAVLEDDSEKRS